MEPYVYVIAQNLFVETSLIYKNIATSLIKRLHINRKSGRKPNYWDEFGTLNQPLWLPNNTKQMINQQTYIPE